MLGLSYVNLNEFPCYMSITWLEYFKPSDEHSSEYVITVSFERLADNCQKDFVEVQVLSALKDPQLVGDVGISVPALLCSMQDLFANIFQNLFQKRDISC